MAQEFFQQGAPVETGLVREYVANTQTNTDTLRSNFSGSVFPANPVVGQHCFRTDEGIEYSYNGQKWQEVSETSKMASELSNARGSMNSLKERLDVAINEDGTLKNPIAAEIDEWKDTAIGVTFVADNQFSVQGDLTPIFTMGRSVKIYNRDNLGAITVGGVTYVVSSAVSDDDETTIVTVGAHIITSNLYDVKYGLLQESIIPSLPVGYIAPFLQSTAPDGWLACQGAEVSRAAYPDLWNYINGSSQLISETDWQSKNTSGEKNIGWFSSGDGTTTFRLPRIVGSGELTEIKRFTTAGDGSFTAPITGIYKITLVGGGGGGGGYSSNSNKTTTGGAGAGAGATIITYEMLVAGTSYSYVIGAGGAGAGTQYTVGGAGGDTTITVNGNAYVAGGGKGSNIDPGKGGVGTINGVAVSAGASGSMSLSVYSGYSSDSSLVVRGGTGGGAGGGTANNNGVFGGGGAGASYNGNTGTNGGDGYIEFAYNPVPQYWYVRAFGSATNQGTIDITALANMLNAKLSISSVPLVAGYNGKQTFTSSGTFTAPITGLYKITLQGGGGGGGGVCTQDWGYRGGGGGGEGGHGVFYESLTAGTTYSFTVGAGGTPAATENTAGTSGGTTTIEINGNAYRCTGGNSGQSKGNISIGGEAGGLFINDTLIDKAIPGGTGGTGTSTNDACGGGQGGGAGGAIGIFGNGTLKNGVYGGGGAGGSRYNNTSYSAGAGGDGYITFEWLDTSLL